MEDKKRQNICLKILNIQTKEYKLCSKTNEEYDE